jgi:thiol-disulfide isomerase/thioredoxin
MTESSSAAWLSRRAWLGVAGVGALVAGIAWQRRGGGSVASSPLPADFWDLSFPDANGIATPLAPFKGQALLLNFWATWCPPCVREMPALDHWAQEAAADTTRVVGLAVDQPQAVAQFLSQHPVSFPVLVANSAGLALSRALGNAAGGLPYSVLLGRNAQLLGQKMGELTAEDLSTWRQLARST